MNHLAPRQIESTKRWDYTCKNDDRIYPIGYCGEAHRNRPTDDAEAPAGHHETEAEACACYKRYLMEQRTQLDRTQELMSQCEYPGCETCTRSMALVDGIWFRVLCDEHRTIEVVAQLYGDVHTSYQS